MICSVVVDTNILVSALWSPSGTPAKLVSLVLTGKITPCYDSNIMKEYQTVLTRPAFKFSEADVSSLLHYWQKAGFSVVARPSQFPMVDESDRKFYDVATFCNATLITGNAKHYPQEPFVVSAAQFLS